MTVAEIQEWCGRHDFYTCCILAVVMWGVVAIVIKLRE